MNKLLTVSMKEDELKSLKRDAFAHCMNVSEYIRWLIEQERKNKRIK